MDEANEFLRWLGERRTILALDSETIGLEFWEKDFVRLVQMGDTETGWSLAVRDWRGLIKIALERYEGPIAGHNIGFDIHALNSGELPAPNWSRLHDTLTLHHLVDPPARHGLKAIAKEIWPQADVGDRMLKAAFHKHGWTWASVPLDYEPYSLYGSLDAVLTARLYEKLMPEVKARGMLSAYEREIAYQGIMHRCERRGLRVDREYTLALRDYWSAERERLKIELQSLGIENPSSNAQVFKALESGGWDAEEFTPTGQPKLDKVILNELVRDLGVPAEIAEKILSYRRMTKWSSSYLDSFLGKRSDDQGRVHPSIRTLGARTGRTSITGPPLQTLPKGPTIRHCILPNEGETLWTVDYDAQELRLFSHYAAEPNLQQLFKDGHDPHSATASIVYGLPLERVGKGTSYRDTAKNVRFARLYGAGTARMAATASASTSTAGGASVSESDIEKFIAGLDREFPGESAFIRYVDEIARTRLADTGRGYVTTWGGRYMPADPDKLYSLVNYLIQGTAADVSKERTVRLDAAGYGDWIMCPVHDEIVFSVPQGGEADIPEVVSIMEDHDNFTVPLTCSAKGPYDRWGRAYE